MTLTPQFLDELRHRTLLSALIGRTTKLQKAGREFRACCPFHNEKSPSFYVNDDKGFYHCFGCGAHGDAIRWMTDNRGLPFIDAVKELVQAAGMEMPAQDRQSAERAERAKGLHEAMADAAAWFTDQLNGIAGAEARSVLEKRGIKAETARTFGLGFAPDSRGKLKDALKTYGDPMLVEAGLLIAVDQKTPYDRFRGRLMIPIRDPRGRPVAFGGRIIGDGEPKYLNSPETPLFDKGRTLYNLDRALPAARQTRRIIVVEGYMDVIALAQAGFGEAVAPLGTALTEHQLDRLWRIAEVPILCFDGDAAGQKAAMRAATRALPLLAPGRSLAFVNIPDGQDPDDVIRANGAGAFETLLRNRQPLVDLLWRHEFGLIDQASPDGRAQLRAKLDQHAESIKDQIVRTEYQRTFRSLFFGEFGWKPRDVAAVRSAMAELNRKKRWSPDEILYRAVLLGVSRYPRVLASEWEGLATLSIDNAYLTRWRDILVEAAVARPGLDADLIETILAESDVSPIERRDLTKDLAFSFFRSDADAAIAIVDLENVIQTLCWEQSVSKALMEVNLRFAQTLAEADWKEQQRLVREKADLQKRHQDFVDLARAA